MSDNDSWVIQWNIKAGPNYMDLINIRAGSVEDLDKTLTDLSERKDVLSALVEEFRAAVVIKSEIPEAQAVKSSAPATGAKVCAHGLAMVYKTGGGTDGKKPWKAWMCSAPREGLNGIPQCQPEWLRD